MARGRSSTCSLTTAVRLSAIAYPLRSASGAKPSRPRANSRNLVCAIIRLRTLLELVTEPAMIAQTRFRLFARGLEGFAPLAERSGYAIVESRTAVLSEQVLLRSRGSLLSSQLSLRV